MSRVYVETTIILYEDPIVAEVHAIRDKMVDSCDGDHLKLMQQVREHQKKTCRRIVSAPVKTGSTESGNAREPVER